MKFGFFQKDVNSLGGATRSTRPARVENEDEDPDGVVLARIEAAARSADLSVKRAEATAKRAEASANKAEALVIQVQQMLVEVERMLQEVRKSKAEDEQNTPAPAKHRADWDGDLLDSPAPGSDSSIPKVAPFIREGRAEA